MAYRKMLKSKIHRAVVTQADLEYEGSLTVCPELLKAADIIPYEAVSIWNINAGTRFETYAMAGEKGSTDVCINGAAAHLVSLGDLIIIASFSHILEEDCGSFLPKIVFVDQFNRLKEIRSEWVGVKNKFTFTV